MCSMYSIYDELEGTTDIMVAYQACHLCHNGNKKCERPSGGGQCRRCANTYISRPWTFNDNPPSFCDEKTTDHVSALLHRLPVMVLPLFENRDAYHTMTFSLANSISSDICEPNKIHFLGPLKHDNNELVQQFDQMVQCNLPALKVDIGKDLYGLVARACLAGGYLNLFFSIAMIKDESQDPLDPLALVLGLAHFILMRISCLVGGVMSLARIGPMSRNARLSLTALHVIVNRIKFFTSRQASQRPLYGNPELSRLLKDRIEALEGELRQLFQDDCGLIKDWGAPLISARREFKNTSQSVDHLTLTIAVTTWDDLPRHSIYPLAISTPSESRSSPLPVDPLPDIELPTMQFAGLEDNQSIEGDESWVSDHASANSGYSGDASSMDYNDIGKEELITNDKDTSYQPTPLYTDGQDILMAGSGNESTYQQLSTPDDGLTDWELLWTADQASNIDDYVQVLGSPLYWGRDPGASDVALD